jgi:hypothetical protein
VGEVVFEAEGQKLNNKLHCEDVDKDHVNLFKDHSLPDVLRVLVEGKN